MNHKNLLQAFKNGKTRGSAIHMYIEDNVLYSYGHHFPLLVRMPWGFLQNADKYSRTTSKHQAETAVIATVMIPFSALNRANINYLKIKLIDKTAARYDNRTYTNNKGEKITVNERRPESCLIEYGKKRFLCSLDNYNYFLSELPGKPKTVDAAFSCLIPDIVKGKEYLRQGEWFFIPLENTRYRDKVDKIHDTIPGTKRNWFLQRPENIRSKWVKIGYIHEFVDPVIKDINDLVTSERRINHFITNRNKQQNPHHYATQYANIKSIPFAVVRGTVRHTGGRNEHRMLKLGDGKTWYIAAESKHVISYGVNGKVD